jgi:hypothetical protein
MASSMTVQPSTCPQYRPFHAKGSSSTPNVYNLWFQATGKPPLLVDGQESLSVLNVWLPRVHFAGYRNDSSTKIVHFFNACRLAHAHVLINKISG